MADDVKCRTTPNGVSTLGKEPYMREVVIVEAVRTPLGKRKWWIIRHALN